MLPRVIPRLLLISAPLLFAMQAGIEQRAGEPYPALILPRFGRAPKHALRPVVVISRQGAILHECSVGDFFSEWPRQNQQSIPWAFLTAEPSATVKQWLAKRAASLEPHSDEARVEWRQ